MIKVADNTNHIQELAESSIEKIKTNARNGIPTTKLDYPKHLAGDVKNEISIRLEESGTKFTWLIINKKINPHTGRTDSFISKVVGDRKHYEIKIQ